MRILCATLLLGCLACSGGGGASNGDNAPSTCESGAAVADALDFVSAFGGEFFTQPVALVQHPIDDDLFYVLERGGRVVALRESAPSTSRVLALDLASVVTLFTGGEGGLFGMAFDPDFATNDEVFLSYTEGVTNDFDSVVGRFVVSNGGLTLSPSAPDPTVIAVDQPEARHNGGAIAFGPDDYLYVALGDGAGGGDPFENGQDTSTLLGSVLRLDVSTIPYSIPPDNPYVGSSGADEIYAFGFRNPWKMSFDPVSGNLWLGDVGENTQEEIDVVLSGGNYGWDCREGFVRFEIDGQCAPNPIRPRVAHAHPEFESITGGAVYRGSAIPELAGSYVYGDFSTGEVCAYLFGGLDERVVSLEPPELQGQGGLQVVSFASARSGELYLLDYLGTPSIYRIDAAP